MSFTCQNTQENAKGATMKTSGTIVWLESTVLFFVAMVTPGCTTTREIYLQDIDVNGPINVPPVHITNNVKPNSLTITPRISLPTTSGLDGLVEGHSLVNNQGYYQVDTVQNSDGSCSFDEPSGVNTNSFRGNNLQWNLPTANATLDFDLPTSPSFSVFGGVSYSSSRNKTLWGGHAGLALFKDGPTSGIRLEGGVRWQSLFYDVSSLVVTTTSAFGSTNTYIMFYRDRYRRTHVNPSGSFTFNSKNPDWPLNLFFQASVAWQTLYNFEPRTADVVGSFFIQTTRDLRGEYTATLFGLTPGVYINFNGSSRLVAGAHILIHDFEDATRNLFIIPMIQLDFDW